MSHGTRSPGSLYTTSPGSKDIVHGWNLLRIFAMLDVATFHLTGRYFLWGMGLPVFLLLSMSLGTSSPLPGTRKRLFEKRLGHLSGAWLFWCLLLALLKVLHALRHHEKPFAWFRPEMLLEGVESHFWYLPFVTIAAWMVYEVDLFARRFAPRRVAAASLLVALATPVLDGAIVYHDPFSQWMFAATALPLGLGFGTLLRNARADRAALTVYAMAFAVGATVESRLLHHGDAGPRFAVALALLVAIWHLPEMRFKFVEAYMPLMLGVFLLHAPLGYALEGRLWRSASLPAPVFVGLVVLLTSALVFALQKTRLKRFL